MMGQHSWVLMVAWFSFIDGVNPNRQTLPTGVNCLIMPSFNLGKYILVHFHPHGWPSGHGRFIGKQAEDPSLSREGMNAVPTAIEPRTESISS